MSQRSAIRLVVLGALVLGCGSGTGSGSGAGGNGGTAGGAGAAGAAGTTGGGGTAASTGHGGGSGSSGGAAGMTGGTGGSSCWPDCIERVQSGCWRPVGGSCSYVVNQGAGRTYCYPNGVTEALDSLQKVHTFANASGTCLVFANTSPPASATMTYSFKDGSGNEIATATSSDNGVTLAVTCGGVTTTVDSSAAACSTLLPHDCTLSSSATCSH